jgi:UDP-glucuronate 4-epimerase
MRIVVTGVGGFIGSHLADHLIAEGHDVVGIDGLIDTYPREHKIANLANLRGSPRFEFHEIDLRTDDLLAPLRGADVVVNEAAVAGMARSWTEFDLYASCNLMAVERLIEAAIAAGVDRFVQISTSSVYGLDAVGDETTPTRPVSPYGVTKLAAEHLVLAHVASRGLRAVILRYFSVYGPRQRPDMAYRHFIDAVWRGDEITVYGDGSQTRSNTYVTDCVRGTIQAIGGARLGEIYNLSGGDSISLRDAIGIIGDALGIEPRIRWEPFRIGDQRHTAGDSTKAREAFDYRPEVSTTDGLRRQVAWQLSQSPA